MSAYTDIEVRIDDPVAVIRLNRPARLNALIERRAPQFQRIGNSD